MYIDPQSVTLPIAVIAGLFSFISPCVLPLVPAYIGYMTAQATNTVSSGLATATVGDGTGTTTVAPSRWVVLMHGVFFVLGFTVIFVFLGISAGAIGQLRISFIQSTGIITKIGGLLIIVLGLHTLGIIRIPFLYYDTRKQEPPKHELGYLGSALMGITFSAGWSPCIGPFLAAMLTLGASTGSVGQATLLLVAYALGLGLPFLLAALLIDQASTGLKKIQKHMRAIEIISGILLIVIGLLVFSGSVQRLSGFLAGSTTDLSIRIDEWLVRLAGGE
jgi:cytochrome c-type biogenesis protein